MPAQYAHLDGRRYVNQDFVDEVRQAYPATTKKIPLGFITYVGWTGKDEVLFTQQEPLPDVEMEGPVFQVNFQPDNPRAFTDGILAKVKHTTKSASSGARVRARSREATLDRWGPTLGLSKEARAAGGLYGYTRAVQASCEAAVRRLNRAAAKLASGAAARDRRVVDFLQTHAGRGQSLPARVLLAAYKNALPRLAADEGGVDKEAAPSRRGMYGYPVKTAKRGLSLCAALRETAGIIGAEMHARRAALHGSITGFFGQHGDIGKCAASSLILSSYPDASVRLRRASEEAPTSVGDWLDYDLSR